MDRVHLADHRRKAVKSKRRLRRRRRRDNPHDKRTHTPPSLSSWACGRSTEREKETDEIENFSPPVARTRVSALDRHADAAANRGRPLAALSGGSRAAASDWRTVLFYPTSHGSRAAPEWKLRPAGSPQMLRASRSSWGNPRDSVSVPKGLVSVRSDPRSKKKRITS